MDSAALIRKIEAAGWVPCRAERQSRAVQASNQGRQDDSSTSKEGSARRDAEKHRTTDGRATALTVDKEKGNVGVLVAIIETNSEGEFFVSVPDFPGVTAAAATKLEALELAVEFANDYVRDLIEDGHAVPPAHDLGEIEQDPEVDEVGRALIPVEIPGKSLKISLSIDEALLARADRAADKVGLTRSGFFAAAVGEKIRESAPSGRQRITPPAGFASSREEYVAERGWGFAYPGDLVPVRLVRRDSAAGDIHVVSNPKGGWDVVRGDEVVSHAPPPHRKTGRRRSTLRKET